MSATRVMVFYDRLICARYMVCQQNYRKNSSMLLISQQRESEEKTLCSDKSGNDKYGQAFLLPNFDSLI